MKLCTFNNTVPKTGFHKIKNRGKSGKEKNFCGLEFCRSMLNTGLREESGGYWYRIVQYSHFLSCVKSDILWNTKCCEIKSEKYYAIPDIVFENV